ncbi:hypothetical protein GOBAR_DD19618 [Gossypium barbadense]|nr:hypothetical protein GOBAR_DD19618 [Gossypium barbadense]
MGRLRAPLEAPPFNALLAELGRRGDVKGMTTVLAEMEESDIMPEVGTLGILVNQLCKLGRVDEAMEVFDKIGEENESDGLSIEADVVIYNTMVDGLCKAGRLEEGLHLMERMKSTKGLAPNTVTYNCLVDGHGRINSAIVFFNDTRGKGPKGNAATLNKPVSSLTSNAIMLLSMGYVRKAYEIIKEMEEVGMKPDSVTCNTLIAYFCKSGDLALALRVMKRMIKDGLVLLLPHIERFYMRAA